MRRLELRAIGDLLPPGLTRGERLRPGRLPEHRRPPPGSRAYEIPLSPAVVARQRFQRDRLVDGAQFNPEPSATLLRHVHQNPARRDHLARVDIGPSKSRHCCCAGTNQVLPKELIQIKLWPVFQPDPLTPTSRLCALLLTEWKNPTLELSARKSHAAVVKFDPTGRKRGDDACERLALRPCLALFNLADCPAMDFRAPGQFA